MHSFKNGITITIPDGLEKEEAIRRWHDVVWQMSILLDPPTPEVLKVRKPYTWTETGERKVMRRRAVLKRQQKVGAKIKK